MYSNACKRKHLCACVHKSVCRYIQECGEGYINYIIYVKCTSYLISYVNYIICIIDT